MNLFDFFSFSSPVHSEIAENGADKVLSSEEENPSVHKTYVNFPTSRAPLYAISSGRSMVEMLGVLAIIGILSVGAIAGYSKAMLKYKLNKQAESLNMLFTNAFQIVKELDNTSTQNHAVYFAEIMYKLNLVPDGIKFDSQWPTHLTDIFDSNIWIYAYPDIYGIGYTFYPGHDGMEICRNLFNVYKQNADVLYAILTDRFISNDEGEEEYERGNAFYGKNYCSNSNKCIHNMSLDDIDTLCHNCLEDSTRCRIYANWK